MHSSRSLADALLAAAIRACVGFVLVVLFAVTGFIALQCVPIVGRVGFGLLSDPVWSPSAGRFGVASMLLASMGVAALAVALALPTGVALAIWARWYAPPGLRSLQRTVMVVAAGMPSVVYGLWGINVLVPLLGRHLPRGPSWLAASLVLALMLAPTVTILSEALLSGAQEVYGPSAAALGLARSTASWQVAVPAVRKGLVSTGVLALSRALGETMAVLMVAGNIPQFTLNPLSPVRTLTSNIVLEMAYALDLHRSALFASAMVLLLGAALAAVVYQWAAANEHTIR